MKGGLITTRSRLKSSFPLNLDTNTHAPCSARVFEVLYLSILVALVPYWLILHGEVLFPIGLHESIINLILGFDNCGDG